MPRWLVAIMFLYFSDIYVSLKIGDLRLTVFQTPKPNVKINKSPLPVIQYIHSDSKSKGKQIKKQYDFDSGSRVTIINSTYNGGIDILA